MASISFASLAPAATSIASSGATTSISPVYTDYSSNLLDYFTIPYLTAHKTSFPTYRYQFYAYFCFIGLVLGWLILSRFDGNLAGAAFRKIAVRRFTFGKGKGKLQRSSIRWATPTVGQLAAISILFIMASLVSIIGPDFINPTNCLFTSSTCGFRDSGPPRSSYNPILSLSLSAIPLSLSVISTPKILASLNPNGWAPFNDPLLAASNVEISANWWTSSNRLGLIAYAFLPICVSLGLKQWPYNILASPFLNFHFDKTAILHRWSGRLIWLLSTAHVATWSVQLSKDLDPYGRMVYTDVLQYWRFQCGIIAYVFLTFLVLLSVNPLRKRYYEFFYCSHIVLIIGFFVACLFHYEPLQYWFVACLVLWIAERTTRFMSFVWINQTFYFDNSRKSSSSLDLREKGHSYPPTTKRYVSIDLERPEIPLRDYKRSSYYAYGPGQDVHSNTPLHSISSSRHTNLPSYSTNSPSTLIPLPAPGYAFAQMLPGKTIRLTIHTPRPIRWSPGQHVFLQIPSVSTLGAHPYTILSIDERSIEDDGRSMLRTSGSEMTLLIRAQKGFSKDLWNKVVSMQQKQDESHSSIGHAPLGFNLRAFVSSPLGSSVQVKWQNYSSILIIAGGTGVTHAVSILTYLCRQMAKRGDMSESAVFKPTRIRFVWILREYAHLSWVATELRRCLEMMDPSQLQLDLHVTTTAIATPPSRQNQPITSRNPILHDLSAYDAFDELPPLDSVTQLVLFDGESEERSTAEIQLSTQMEREGKTRRANSRKLTKLFKGTATPPSRSTTPSRSRSKSESPFLKNSPSQTQLLNSPLSGSPVEQLNSSYFVERPALSRSRNDKTANYYDSQDQFEETRSIAPSRTGSSRGLLFRDEVDAPIRLSKEDEDTLKVLSEIARVGHPRLERVMQEELARSEGKMMVTACGPSSLNTIARHLVSTSIDLEKISRGDSRGDVDLSVEDFSF